MNINQDETSNETQIENTRDHPKTAFAVREKSVATSGRVEVKLLKEIKI